MLLNKKKNINRLGVFIFFDVDHIVDDYVIYMLDSLKEAVNDIIFVSNSELDEKELDKVRKYTDKIHIRENKGLDAGAFKYAYDLYGSDYFAKYDEVLLMNDTFFGPFKPFKDIFKEMESKDLDFWGLTANYDSVDGTGKALDGFIHAHIQTYFVVYRNSVVTSEFFNRYWKNYKTKDMMTFLDVVNKHESYFTYALEKHGFKWDTYVDMSHYKENEIEKNYNVYGYSAYSLIKNYNCPFIKRKNFVFNKNDALYLSSGADTALAFDYIKNNIDYDTNMILKNITRIYNPIDIYKELNLNYIIKEEKSSKFNYKLIIKINDQKTLDLVKPYLNKSYICLTENKDLTDLKYIDNAYQYIKDNKSKFVKDNDIIGLINLDRIFTDFIPEIDDSNVIRTIEDNLLSEEYINGILNIFKDKFISMLVTSESMHNLYFSNLSNYFYMNVYDKYSEVLKLDEIFLACSKNAIWIRSEILNDMPEVEGMTLSEYITLLPHIKNSNYKLLGKISNPLLHNSDTISLENMVNTIIDNDEIKISYPNIYGNYFKGSGFFRRTYRKLFSKKFRKKIKKIIFRKYY